MAYQKYLIFNGTEMQLPTEYEVSKSDIESDGGGQTEAGTTRRDIIREGVPALQLVDIGFDMGVTKESLFSTLQFPRATINRKIAKNDVLPPEFSERMVGLQKLIGQVEVMVEQSGNPENFNAAHWLAQWLNEPLPALGNERPADFMDTVEGQELISNLLLQMQTGAYA